MCDVGGGVGALCAGARNRRLAQNTALRATTTERITRLLLIVVLGCFYGTRALAVRSNAEPPASFIMRYVDRIPAVHPLHIFARCVCTTAPTAAFCKQSGSRLNGRLMARLVRGRDDAV